MAKPSEYKHIISSILSSPLSSSLKKKHKWSTKHMKRSLVSLAIREMKCKITMIYCFTLTRLVSGGSDSKESACNAGDPGSVPGLERSVEKGTATHSNILAWRIPWTEELVSCSSWGHKESDTTERLSLSGLVD